MPGVHEILTVTNRELFFKTRDEYREVDRSSRTSFVLEPFGRGTAAAIACARAARRTDPRKLRAASRTSRPIT
jgi:mannose-1-phosphate guanylyltransferase